MDKFSDQLDKYLKIVHSSKLLVDDADRANINTLLTMLGTIDKDIFDAYYGLFGTPVMPVEQLALKYRVPQSAIQEIIEKDLHKVSITPEWQIMMRQLRPAVIKKLLS